MDDMEKENEVQQTERVERLTVTPNKPVLGKSGQDMKALLDDSCDTEPGCKDLNHSSSNLLVIENNQNAVDGCTNGIPDSAENSFSVAENVSEVLSQCAASGIGADAIESIDISSFVDSSAEADEEMDSSVAADNNSHMMSVNTYDTSQSIEPQNREDDVHDESFLKSADESSFVNVTQASAVSIESYDEQLTEAAELSVRDTTQSEITTEGIDSYVTSEPTLEMTCASVNESDMVENNSLPGDQAKTDSDVHSDADWQYVLEHEGLKKRVVRQGSSNDRPLHGQLVEVKCCGHLQDGTEIDKHDCLRLTLGNADLVSAFDLCIPLMDQGEICEIVSDTEYAYGSAGREPDVPPNAVVTYNIELLSFEDQPSVPVCHPAFNDADTESELKSLEELYSSVKEPEEADHVAKCHLLHDDKMADQPMSETSNDWLCILGHNRLKKRVIRAGHEGDRPQRGQLVTVKCCGRLEDGTEIDRHDELKLVLGDADFIDAFDLCIALMDREEKCELISDSQYAYGGIGREPDVPPNANITYEIELLSFEDQPSLSTLPVCERLQLSNEKRERGNHLYARNECIRAIGVYEKAIKIADPDNASSSELASDLQLLLESRIKCYNNLAAAQLKIEAWDEAIMSCNNVLKVQHDNVKALFRKAKCLISKGDYDTAIALLKRAQNLDPDNKTVQNELMRIEKRNKELESHRRQLYKKMLGTAGDDAAASRQEGTKSWRWYTLVGIAVVILSAGMAAYRRFSHA